MKPLKLGWRMVKFGDIAHNVAVRVDPTDATTDIYVGLEHLDPSTLHLRHWGHPSDVTGQKLAFKKGDVIFGRRRAYQRKLAVAEFDGICSAHAMVVRAKPKMILPEFLPFFLQSDMFMECAIEISVGSLSPTINWKTLQVQEFPLPPLEEQKRIAEILWAADEAVEKYLVAQQDLKKLEGKLITNFFGHKDYTLGELGNWVGGGTPCTKNKTYWSGEIPWVSPKDLKATELFDSEDHISAEAISNSSTRVVPPGTILVAFRTGILRHTFPVVIARKDMAINQDLKALLPSERFVPEFVAGYLMFRAKDILRECVKSGTTVESIDLGLFKKIRIPLPALVTQRIYAKEATTVADSKSLMARNTEAIKMTARSFMNSTGAAHV